MGMVVDIGMGMEGKVWMVGWGVEGWMLVPVGRYVCGEVVLGGCSGMVGVLGVELLPSWLRGSSRGVDWCDLALAVVVAGCRLFGWWIKGGLWDGVGDGWGGLGGD